MPTLHCPPKLSWRVGAGEKKVWIGGGNNAIITHLWWGSPVSETHLISLLGWMQCGSLMESTMQNYLHLSIYLALNRVRLGDNLA
jgi:hypothetical protein